MTINPPVPYPPVPYDPELVGGLARFLSLVEQVPLRADTIQENRAIFGELVPSMDEIVAGRAVEWRDVLVPGWDGAPEVAVTVVRPAAGAAARDDATPPPGVLHLHGGGMMLGNRLFGIETLIGMALEHGTVGVSVEYRLAPEHPDPAPVQDCYAGLVWMTAHAEELGLDPERLLVLGASAGAGLSAGVCLMARDLGGPRIAGQVLIAPMIDDRNDTVSSLQYNGIGAWDRNNNDTGWNALLGERRGTDAVSPYAAPARARDLSGLPPAFIEVGAAEVFRDEAVGYASRIWAAGGQAELHVWAGGFHGFSGAAPEARVSRAAIATQRAWIERTLGL